VKIFIDVDNTIIEHYGIYNLETESRIHKSIGRHPHKNKDYINIMYKTGICRDPKTIKELYDLNHVYILTKYSNDIYESSKRERLAEILEMSVEEMISKKDSSGVNKYIAVKFEESKVEVVKNLFNVENMNNLVLIDDYSQNLIEWESHGGIGIKYYNEYNSPSHPLNGIAISNFKIFDYFIHGKGIENFIVVGENRYKNEILLRQMIEFGDSMQHIDILHQIFLDITSKFGIDSTSEQNRYNFKNLGIEYYKFLDEVDSSRFYYDLDHKLDRQRGTLLMAPFEPNMERLKELPKFKEERVLTLSVLSSKGKKQKQIYDMYVNINDNHSVDNFSEIFHRINTIIIKVVMGK